MENRRTHNHDSQMLLRAADPDSSLVSGSGQVVAPHNSQHLHHSQHHLPQHLTSGSDMQQAQHVVQKAQIRLRSNESQPLQHLQGRNQAGNAAISKSGAGNKSSGAMMMKLPMEQQPVLKQVKLKQSRNAQNMRISLKQSYLGQSMTQYGHNHSNVLKQEDYQDSVTLNKPSAQHSSASGGRVPSHQHEPPHAKQHSQSFQQLLPLVDLQKMKLVKFGQGPPVIDQNQTSSNNVGKQGQSTSTQLYAPSSQAVVLKMLQQNQHGYHQQQHHLSHPHQMHKQQQYQQLASPQKQTVPQLNPAKASTKRQPTQKRTTVLVTEISPQKKLNKEGAAVIPAYTSEEARQQCEQGELQYPGQPHKYRKVNSEMDKELIWYRQEIERRFAKSSMQFYQFQRIEAKAGVEQDERDRFILQMRLSPRARSRSKGDSKMQGPSQNNIRVLSKAELKLAKANEVTVDDEYQGHWQQEENAEEENLDARQSLIQDEGETYYKAVHPERQKLGSEDASSAPLSHAASSNQDQKVPNSAVKCGEHMTTNENYVTNQTDLATITHGSSHVVQNSQGVQSIVSPSLPIRMTHQRSQQVSQTASITLESPACHNLVDETAAKRHFTDKQQVESDDTYQKGHHPMHNMQLITDQEVVIDGHRQQLTASFSKVELKKITHGGWQELNNKVLAEKIDENYGASDGIFSQLGGPQHSSNSRNEQRSQTQVELQRPAMAAGSTPDKVKSTKYRISMAKRPSPSMKVKYTNPSQQQKPISKQNQSILDPRMKFEEQPVLAKASTIQTTKSVKSSKKQLQHQVSSQPKDHAVQSSSVEAISLGHGAFYAAKSHVHHKSSVSLKKSIAQVKSQRSNSSSRPQSGTRLRSANRNYQLKTSVSKNRQSSTYIVQEPLIVSQPSASFFKAEPTQFYEDKEPKLQSLTQSETKNSSQSMSVLSKAQQQHVQPVSASKKTRNQHMRQHQSLYDFVYPSRSLNEHMSGSGTSGAGQSLPRQEMPQPSNKHANKGAIIKGTSILNPKMSNTQQQQHHHPQNKRTDTAPILSQFLVNTSANQESLAGPHSKHTVQTAHREHQLSYKASKQSIERQHQQHQLYTQEETKDQTNFSGLPQILTEPTTVKVKVPHLQQLTNEAAANLILATEGDDSVETDTIQNKTGTNSSHTIAHKSMRKSLNLKQMASNRKERKSLNTKSSQIQTKYQQSTSQKRVSHGRNSQHSMIKSVVENSRSMKQDRSLGRADQSKERSEKGGKLAAQGSGAVHGSKQSPFRALKRQSDLLIESFDENSVAQAYDSSKFADGGKQEQQSSSSHQQQQHYRRNHHQHASTNKRQHQKSMQQTRVNTSMDEQLNRLQDKKMPNQSPQMTIQNQSIGNLQMLSNQKQTLTASSKNHLQTKQQVHYSQQQANKNNHSKQRQLYEEANILHDDSLGDLRQSQSRQPIDISISKIQGATLGSAVSSSHQPAIYDGNFRDSKSSLPRKQRQNQNYIDLEAIKKSINMKISQNSAEARQQELQLLALLKSQQGIQMQQQLAKTSASNSAISASFFSSKNAYGQEKPQAVASLNRNFVQIPHASKLQELQKNQQMVKKAKKRNQGLILNNHSFQQVVHHQSSQSSMQTAGATAAGGANANTSTTLQPTKKQNSRNQTFSMSQDGFVLTASRSKSNMIKLDSGNNSMIQNQPKQQQQLSLHDAYQTPGTNQSSTTLQQPAPSQQKASVTYGVLAQQKQRTLSASKLKQNATPSALSAVANQKSLTTAKPTHNRNSATTVNNYFVNTGGGHSNARSLDKR